MGEQKEDNWFNSIFDQARDLSEISYALEGLAKAFARTGNHEMGQELISIGVQIRESTKAITDAVGSHINSEFQKTQRALADTLSAALKA